MEKIWRCPKCKRIFKRAKQQHSCTIHPVEKHFERKEYAKEIYNHLKRVIKKKIRPFIVESLPCCIHFVTKDAYTFAAVYGLKDKIRLHLVSGELPKGVCVKEFSKLSSSRYLYSIDVASKDEIDAELVKRIRQAFHFVN
jgi:hypothetical protein